MVWSPPFLLVWAPPNTERITMPLVGLYDILATFYRRMGGAYFWGF